MADDEIVEGEEAPAEEAAADEGGGQEFVPEMSAKPRSDVYTALLVLGCLAFLSSIILAGMELYEYYDVNFWVLGKK